MKFAKELEQDAVPEWRVKYLNYKSGKKHIKTVTRAISRAITTPTLPRRSDTTASEYPYTTPSSFFGINNAFTPPGRTDESPATELDEPDPFSSAAGSRPTTSKLGRSATSGDERSGLAHTPGSGMQYGSFGLPPSRASDKIDWELPGPAMRVPSNTNDPPLKQLALQRSASMVEAEPLGRSPSLALTAGGTTPRLRVSRLFSHASTHTRTHTRHGSNKFEIGMQNLDYVRTAEREFFRFLDSELDKIETFYREKEDQATDRLAALRAQLHEMRNRRTAEIAEVRKKREAGGNSGHSDDTGERSKDNSRDWFNPLKDRFIKPGPNSKALQKMTRTPVMTGQEDDGRDYVRRPPADDVPYRTAKRKLKLALQEFYRSLELLKSYALLNRTAFRKLNKKYDKAVHARPPYRYMNEKVNKTWFVNSDILDGHIRTVEDLYARYFEKGNRKIAAGKLRNLQKGRGDSSDSAFRSGLLIGIGAVFTVQGLIFGAELLFDKNDDFAEQTGYLLQLYGGYFLVLLLFSLFTLDCRMWTKNKVNYPFIFEFDSRNFLDWKQLAEFPSFFFALFGVFIWLNFSRLGNWEEMYLYYPVVLIGISVIILFFPAPVLHHKARKWFLYSHYRLLLSGLYPVEFRDFFLGDIWCSLTYAVCNVELFFCLYARAWNEPDICNSSHSRLLGFFGALPPIWRALQCLRRYNDTRNVFPHLVNCGKYTMTIVTAVCLSVYRIDDSHTGLSLYIAFAAINAIYCSIWDLFMDFSLLQANARQRLLRDITALRPVWVYYLIMVIDPMLRFSWIFYAIFTHNTQHSTVVSFCVSLSEVIRRGMWTLLRVENEHCANVAQYKAARDTPLPYNLEQFIQRPSLEAAATAATTSTDNNPPNVTVIGATPLTTTPQDETIPTKPSPMPSAPTPLSEPTAAIEMSTATATALEEGGGRRASATFRPRHRRQSTLGKRSILQAMAEAHKQDFVKKRPPVEGAKSTDAMGLGEEEDEEAVLQSEEEDEDDDDDEESDREDGLQREGVRRRMRSGVGGVRGSAGEGEGVGMRGGKGKESALGEGLG